MHNKDKHSDSRQNSNCKAGASILLQAADQNNQAPVQFRLGGFRGVSVARDFLCTHSGDKQLKVVPSPLLPSILRLFQTILEDRRKKKKRVISKGGGDVCTVAGSSFQRYSTY